MVSKKRIPKGDGQGVLESQAVAHFMRELLRSRGVSALRCAQDIGVAHSQIYGLTTGSGTRNVTAVLALKLGRYFGINPEELMLLQVRRELAVAMQVHGDDVQAITPLQAPSVASTD